MAACGGRILVVDPDAQFTASVISLVRNAGYEAVGVVGGEEALDLARDDAPDVVVVTVELPGISGYEVCRRLREQLGPIGILMVSSTRTESLDRAAGLLIGADDYLAKPFAPDELLARIHALLRRAAARPSPSPTVRRTSGLTNREQEVLELLAAGASQADIAGRLVISPKTVGAHIGSILSKLDVHSRAQAVAVAYRDDLLGV
jgi:DNA-binding NarL/FixJ family response regulator